MDLKRFAEQKMQTVMDKVMHSGLSQDSSLALGNREIMNGMPELIRQAGAEGCVLLENNGVLPLQKDEAVAVFGRCQYDWFCVGYGSGGDIHPPYKVNLIDGFKAAGVKYDLGLAKIYEDWIDAHPARDGFWGHWPMSHDEMPVDKATLRAVASRCDTAVVVLGRAAGEDRENTLTQGSYYLTKEEETLLAGTSELFRNVVVVLNIGNIIDFSWVEKYRPAGLLIAWQGGMESGNAVTDVLYGTVSPCGRLTDSIAKSYEAYPTAQNFGGKEETKYQEGIFLGYRYFEKDHEEDLLYPFAYGLSYTNFDVTPMGMAYNEKTNKITVQVRVTNTGNCPGKEVVTLWCAVPEGRLSQPARVLVGFAKTETLQPSERQVLLVSANLDYMTAYDELKHAYVYEEGEYKFIINNTYYSSIYMRENQVQHQCKEAAVPDVDLKQRILHQLPESITPMEFGYTFKDVVSGRAQMKQFVAQLSKEELEALTRGHGFMDSPLGTAGNAGVIGGILPSLQEKGVPAVTLTDGPSGIRLNRYSSLLPIGTCLASTWNLDLVTDLYETLAEEMKLAGSNVLLAPGMNLHRNPLCGRNFEYFSEDPLLSGFMGAAVVRGLQRHGVSACPKHFCCNNQETNRANNNSVVSERALRELYLRNFEICVKEGQPWCIMTSYNKINGIWGHYNYDTVTTILRKEWGYDGLVITDWWMKKAVSPEFPKLQDNAYRVRAGVDVLMPGDMNRLAKSYKADKTLLESLDKKNGITLGEIQLAAMHTLEFLQKLS